MNLRVPESSYNAECWMYGKNYNAVDRMMHLVEDRPYWFVTKNFQEMYLSLDMFITVCQLFVFVFVESISFNFSVNQRVFYVKFIVYYFARWATRSFINNK